MRLSTEQRDGVAVVSVKGRLDVSSSPAFIEAMQEGEEQPTVLEMSELEYLSSAGLRVILMAAKRATQTQGRLLLCQLQDNVREVLEISGFLKILDVHPDMQAARGALATAGN